jgi:hypothetical protein
MNLLEAMGALQAPAAQRIRQQEQEDV